MNIECLVSILADVTSFRVLQGQGLGKFDDISELTMFADYRVPVVLRQMGILVYSAQLANTVGPQKILTLKSKWHGRQQQGLTGVAATIVDTTTTRCGCPESC